MEAIFRIFLVIVVVLSTALATCPDGWLRHSGSCYLFSHDKFSWPEASVVCKLFGGYLAEIGDVHETTYLGQQAKIHGNAYYIGLTDISEEGTWLWIESKQQATYTNWEPGEPDTAHITDENCAEIYQSGKWNDASCSLPHYYICELDDRNVEVIG